VQGAKGDCFFGLGWHGRRDVEMTFYVGPR